MDQVFNFNNRCHGIFPRDMFKKVGYCLMVETNHKRCRTHQTGPGINSLHRMYKLQEGYYFISTALIQITASLEHFLPLWV